jgi:hypothetical protein
VVGFGVDELAGGRWIGADAARVGAALMKAMVYSESSTSATMAAAASAETACLAIFS